MRKLGSLNGKSNIEDLFKSNSNLPSKPNVDDSLQFSNKSNNNPVKQTVDKALKDVTKKDSKVVYYAVIGSLILLAIVGWLWFKFKGGKK